MREHEQIEAGVPDGGDPFKYSWDTNERVYEISDFNSLM